VPAGDQGGGRAFPQSALAKLGYVHQAIHGQKAYHGVAVLSRLPFKKTGTQDFCREGHARHMGVTFENGLELHNFYVPAGGDIPIPGRMRNSRTSFISWARWKNSSPPAKLRAAIL